jgi:trehalose monomycolate/heme transporter
VPQQHSAPSAEPTRSMQPAGPDSEATTAIPVQRANGTQGGPDEPPTRAIPVAQQTRTGDTEAATKRVNARGESTRGEGSEDTPRRGESVSAQDLLRREGRL